MYWSLLLAVLFVGLPVLVILFMKAADDDDET
jgi:hypothetical protein